MICTIYKDTWRRFAERGYSLEEVERHENWVRKIIESTKRKFYEKVK
jgi:hypothetical protein